MHKDSQIDKFKAAAKEAECDMDEKDFDEALVKLSKSEKPADDAATTPSSDNPSKAE